MHVKIKAQREFWQKFINWQFIYFNGKTEMSIGFFLVAKF
jgi:hypothetical protein